MLTYLKLSIALLLVFVSQGACASGKDTTAIESNSVYVDGSIGTTFSEPMGISAGLGIGLKTSGWHSLLKLRWIASESYRASGIDKPGFQSSIAILDFTTGRGWERNKVTIILRAGIALGYGRIKTTTVDNQSGSYDVSSIHSVYKKSGLVGVPVQLDFEYELGKDRTIYLEPFYYSYWYKAPYIKPLHFDPDDETWGRHSIYGLRLGFRFS